MDPRKYSQILRGISFDEIYLESSSVAHNRESLLKQKELEISIRDRASCIQQDNKIRVTHKYFLTAKNSATEKDIVIKISVNFCLIYSTSSPFEKEFFEIFKNVNLPVNSWPYFREFVQSMTQRMNIPPITLPLVKRG
jgi:preprotein translocase subunit SecB